MVKIWGCLLEVAVKKIRKERLRWKCVLISWFRAEIIVVNEGEDLLLILKSWNIEGLQGRNLFALRK